MKNRLPIPTFGETRLSHFGAVAYIDLAALRHNFQIVRKYAGASKVMAVIKANAYGHDVAMVASALSDADGFAVARIDEGLFLSQYLQQSELNQTVTVLQGYLNEAELEVVTQNKLVAVVGNLEQADVLAKLIANTASKKSLPGANFYWLKHNSGMNRLGMSCQELLEVRKNFMHWGISNIGLMTHMCCADEPDNPLNQHQIDSTLALHATLEKKYGTHSISICNSAALMTQPKAHQQWVRPGIMLYGISPVAKHKGSDFELKPVMQLVAPLMSVYDIKAGESVGYAAKYTAAKSHRIGIVRIGYGDGYPRHAPTGTPVLVQFKGDSEFKRVSVIGRVSMDSLAIDLTNAKHARTGDTVLLWGDQLPVEEVAEYIGTIGYELVTRVSQRVARVALN